MNADGSNVTRLTNDPAIDTSPSFSPDGARILFVSDRVGNNEIYTIDAATGGNLTRLTNNTADDRDPVFSPDGSRIAFGSNRWALAILITTSRVLGGTQPIQLTTEHPRANITIEIRVQRRQTRIE